MDDKDRHYQPPPSLLILVQIPLWTIRTIWEVFTDTLKNTVQIPLWTIRTIPDNVKLYAGMSSDSSMDDKDK